MPRQKLTGKCRQTGSRLIGLYFLVCCYTVVAQSQEKITEEITVTGDNAKVNLQLAVDRAEDEFFALFNSLIDEEEFKIECRYEKVIGSLIKQRICQTRYMRDELTRAANLSYVGVEYIATARLSDKNRQLRKKTIELLEQNAELRSAASNLSQRVEEYQDEYGIEAGDD